MDRVIAYDPGDLTLSVEAGVPLQSLGQTLAEHRQFLPLAMPFLAQTTIGGTIASGVDSPLRQFYGTARDFLLGMEFVTGEGVAAKSGGRVVKNVTGYDIHKLMIGALGTLGVITRVNFKTFPMPMRSRGFVARFATAERAFDMRDRVARSVLTPLTMEILSPRVAELFESEAASRYEPAPMPRRRDFAHGMGADDRLCGERGSARNATPRICSRWPNKPARRESRCSPRICSRRSTASANLFRLRWILRRRLDLKISVLPARMAETLDTRCAAAESNALPWAAMARGARRDLFRAAAGRTRRRPRKCGAATATDAIHLACAELGGHSTIPWCPAEWKSKLKIWGLAAN